jgi:nucleoside-diphosphate-sugar epimerase
MRVLVVGGAGMLGRKLLERLLHDRQLLGKELQHVVVADQTLPELPGSETVELVGRQCDISNAGDCDRLVAHRPDVIFHLAAVVSGQAESDFEVGYRVNVDGTRQLLEAIRRVGDGYVPRVVFSSSVAVYGGPYPAIIDDSFHLTPRTSYGVQKAIGEMFMADYSRKGFIDAVGIRLPTVCVRPGAPNAASSGVFSNILREPLSGKPATLTVPRDVSMVFCSPRTAVGFLVHAARIDTGPLGHQRSLMMPAVTATIADQLDALGRIAGEGALALITEKLDPVAEATVRAWDFPGFTSERALELGFVGDESVDDLIKIFLEDDLPPQQ